jgi:putative endonuclease
VRAVKDYYVYIATNRGRTLYTGVTNNVQRRQGEHNRIVYYERFNDVRMAIAREKQIKGWWRSKNVELIESVNPRWMEGESPWLP